MQAAAAGQQQTRINWLYLGTSILYTYTRTSSFGLQLSTAREASVRSQYEESSSQIDFIAKVGKGPFFVVIRPASF